MVGDPCGHVSEQPFQQPQPPLAAQGQDRLIGIRHALHRAVTDLGHLEVVEGMERRRGATEEPRRSTKLEKRVATG